MRVCPATNKDLLHQVDQNFAQEHVALLLMLIHSVIMTSLLLFIIVHLFGCFIANVNSFGYKQNSKLLLKD